MLCGCAVHIGHMTLFLNEIMILSVLKSNLKPLNAKFSGIGRNHRLDGAERQNRDIELKPTHKHTHTCKQASKQHIEFTFL